ncbi:hypothetical protein FQN60_005378, partial [Etheostoma spectabile]
QENGQRRYGGPPPSWDGPPPERGSEIFVGKLPRDLFEDELVPLCEKFGRIYEVRMMMDFNGNNRGYAFVTFGNKMEAKAAMKQLNNYEIRSGRLLGVCASVDNCRLFVGGIPKTKKREEILAEMRKVTDGVVDVVDGSPIEVTLAKPVDKDSYVRYTRGTGGRGASLLQTDYAAYTLGQVLPRTGS